MNNHGAKISLSMSGTAGSESYYEVVVVREVGVYTVRVSYPEVSQKMVEPLIRLTGLRYGSQKPDRRTVIYNIPIDATNDSMVGLVFELRAQFAKLLTGNDGVHWKFDFPERSDGRIEIHDRNMSHRHLTVSFVDSPEGVWRETIMNRLGSARGLGGIVESATPGPNGVVYVRLSQSAALRYPETFALLAATCSYQPA